MRAPDIDFEVIQEGNESPYDDDADVVQDDGADADA